MSNDCWFFTRVYVDVLTLAFLLLSHEKSLHGFGSSSSIDFCCL